jgi:ABC-2 type transport system permease protein
MPRVKSPLGFVFLREAEQIKHNPAYRFLLLTGPLIAIALFYFIFQKGVVKEIPIAVVNQDHSSLSIKIENNLNAASEVELALRTPDLFQAREAMAQARVEAIVLIPEETEKSVLTGAYAPVPIYINGANVLTAGLLQRSILTTLKTISGGIQLKKLMATGLTEEQAMERMVPVRLDAHALFNPYLNYNFFLSSALFHLMLFLFVLLSSIYTLGAELKRGTGHELLVCSNGSVRLALLGKLAPFTMIYAGFAMLIDLVMFKFQGTPLNGSLLILLTGQVVAIVSCQLMGVIFVGITNNLRLALSLGSGYSMVGMTFCGLTYPVEGMPAVAQLFTGIFPMTWWEKIYISQSLYNGPVKEALVYICYLLIFKVVSLAFLPVYKKYLSDSKYWGKA